MQLEQLFSQTKDLPLEVVEGLLGALLTIRDPALPRLASSSSSQSRDTGGGGNGVSGGGGSSGSSNSAPAGLARNASSNSGASFEAHAVLALELSSKVFLANRHRVSILWPALHSFLARWVGIERRRWRSATD